MTKTINWFMSLSLRELLIRIPALSQRKTLLETKNRTLKCSKRHYSTVRAMKNVGVLTEDGAFALFFFPTLVDLTAQESPPPGICHPRQKKDPNARGSAREGGLGTAGIDFTKTIIPLALIAFESKAHSAFGLMGY